MIKCLLSSQKEHFKVAHKPHTQNIKQSENIETMGEYYPELRVLSNKEEYFSKLFTL